MLDATAEVTTLVPTDAFLPVGRMRQITRLVSRDAGRIVGVMDVDPGHWVFEEHFPGDPIFPGCLLVEAAGQLLALAAWFGGLRGRPRLVRASAEFRAPVRPDVGQLTLIGEVTRRRNMHFGKITIRAGEAEVASVAAVLAVLPDE